MGLWSSLKDSIHDANEEAHASRLKRDADATIRLAEDLMPELKAQVVRGFLARRQKLLLNIPNWSKEGQLKIARDMFDRARKEKDFNVAGSLANALAAIWLESRTRPHPVAAIVHEALDRNAMQWEEAALTKDSRPAVSQGTADSVAEGGSPPRQRGGAAEKSSSSEEANGNDEVETAFLDSIDFCLAQTLCFAYGWSAFDLASLSSRLTTMPPERWLPIRCVAFGMIDSLSQAKSMSERATLMSAAAFFHQRLFAAPAEALQEVTRLTKLRKGMDGYYLVVKAGQAMRAFSKDKRLDAFKALGREIA